MTLKPDAAAIDAAIRYDDDEKNTDDRSYDEHIKAMIQGAYNADQGLARLVADYKKLRQALKDVPYMSQAYMQHEADRVLHDTQELP